MSDISANPQAGALSLNAVANQGTPLSPVEVQGITQASATPGQAVDNAKAVAQFKSVATEKQYLQKQDIGTQVTYWNKLNGTQQSQLRNNGYEDPTGGQAKPGLFSNLLGSVGHAVKDIVDPFGVAGKALHAMNAGEQFVQHAARASQVTENPNGSTGSSLEVLNPLHWAKVIEQDTGVSSLMDLATKGTKAYTKAWDETKNGQSYIMPAVKRQVQAQYGKGPDGPLTYQLALMRADGISDEAILENVTPSQAGTVQRLLQGSQVDQATMALNAGHLSFGRQILGEKFIAAHPDLGNKVSGLLDATNDMLVDPMNLVPGLGEAGDVAKLFRSGDDIMRLGGDGLDHGNLGQRLVEPLTAARQAGGAGIGTIPGAIRRMSPAHVLARTLGGSNLYGAAARSQFWRAADRITEHVGNGDRMAITREFNLPPEVADDLVKGGVTSRDKYSQFLQDNLNVQRMMTSNSTHLRALADHTGGILPTLSHAKLARLKTSGWLRRNLEPTLDDLPEVTHADLKTPELSSVMHPSVGNEGKDALDKLNGRTLAANPVVRLRQGFGQLARHMTTIAPDAATRGAQDLMKPGIAKPLNATLRGFLTSRRADDLTNLLLAAPDLATRKVIYRNVMREVGGGAAGMDSSSKYWQTFMRQFDDEPGAIMGERATYGPDDIDVVHDGEQKLKDGILEPHMSHEVALPDFTQMYKEAKRQGKLQVLFGDHALNWGPISTLSGMWARASVARPALGLRFGAAEAILGILRHGPAGYARSVADGVLARGLKDLSPKAMDDLNHGSMFQRWFGHLPDSVKQDLQVARQGSDLDAASAYYGYHYGREVLPDESAERAAKYRQQSRTWHAISNPAAKARAYATIGAYRMTSQETQAGIRALVQHHVLDLPSSMSAVEHGYLGSEGEHSQMRDTHGALREVVMKDVAEFKQLGRNDPDFLHAFQKQLGEIKGSKWAQTSWIHRDARPADRLHQVADTLKADPFWTAAARRSKRLPDGRVVGVDATEDEAALSHADVINKLVDKTVTGKDGTVAPEMRQMMASDELPTLTDLDKLDQDILPDSVKGRQRVALFPEDLGSLRKLSDFQFKRIIGPQVNAISRQPLFIHAYLDSRNAFSDLAAGWRRAGLDDTQAEEMLHQASLNRATGIVKPFIHNPELRTQWEHVTRNLAPFLFAKRQMYSRWVKSAAINLALFHQAELVNDAALNIGFLKKNAQGEEYFVYPGSGVVSDGITHFLTKLGLPSDLPIQSLFTGNLAQLDPDMEGITNPLQSGVVGDEEGPLMTLPLDTLAKIVPGWKGSIDTIEGGTSEGPHDFVTDLVPSPIARVFQAVDPAEFNKQAYTRAQLQAISMLEASGHGIGQEAITDLGEVQANPNDLFTNQDVLRPGDFVTWNGTRYVYETDKQWRVNTVEQEDTELKRVQNYAHILLTMKALGGLLAPASPELQVGGSMGLTLNKDYSDALNRYGYQEGLAKFLQVHPDATPLTVATSQNTNAQTATTPDMSATNGSYQWMQENFGFLQRDPQVAFYFMPPADTAGQYNSTAEDMQFAANLRQLKTPQDFYNQVVYGQAATAYYATADKWYAAIDQARAGGDSKSADAMQAQWSADSAAFKKVNPIFASYVNASPDRASQRQQLMQESIPEALDTPDAKKQSTYNDVAGLVQLYNEWQAQRSDASTLSKAGYSVTETQIDQAYAPLFTKYAAEHPGAQALFQYGVRPDLSDELGFAD